jgi:hypothetical protein
MAGFLGVLLAAAILLCGSATANAAPTEHGHAGSAPAGALLLSIPDANVSISIPVRDGVFAEAWHAATGPQAAGQTTQTEVTPLVSLPAPAALWLFGSGLCALGLTRRRIIAPWRRHKARREEAVATERIHAPDPDWRLVLRQRMRHASATQFANGGASHRCSGIPPGASDGRGGTSDPPRRGSITSLMQGRFEELAAALVEQPSVALGRSFGCPCIKYGKRPFLVFDEQVGGIAFRVGEQSADALLAEFSLVEYWNPKQDRQPKQSWLVCRVSNGEALVQLAAAAYEYALAEAEPRITSGECPAAEFASV